MRIFYTGWKRVCFPEMRFLKTLKHIGIIILGVFLAVGVPFLGTGYLNALFSDSPDAVSSASVVLDAPSGDFIILINKDLHADEDNLNDWIRFFSGSTDDDELLIIFEDIAASVAYTDTAGLEMADSFRSQLPENQMKIKKEDVTVLLSRADAGLFDMIIMSGEFAQIYHLETAYKNNVEVVEIKGE